MWNTPFCLVVAYLYNIYSSGSLELRTFQGCLCNIAFMDAQYLFSSKLGSKVFVTDIFIKKVILNHISVAGHLAILYQKHSGVWSEPLLSLSVLVIYVHFSKRHSFQLIFLPNSGSVGGDLSLLSPPAFPFTEFIRGCFNFIFHRASGSICCESSPHLEEEDRLHVSRCTPALGAQTAQS